MIPPTVVPSLSFLTPNKLCVGIPLALKAGVVEAAGVGRELAVDPNEKPPPVEAGLPPNEKPPVPPLPNTAVGATGMEGVGEVTAGAGAVTRGIGTGAGEGAGAGDPKPNPLATGVSFLTAALPNPKLGVAGLPNPPVLLASVPNPLAAGWVANAPNPLAAGWVASTPNPLAAGLLASAPNPPVAGLPKTPFPFSTALNCTTSLTAGGFPNPLLPLLPNEKPPTSTSWAAAGDLNPNPAATGLTAGGLGLSSAAAAAPKLTPPATSAGLASATFLTSTTSNPPFTPSTFLPTTSPSLPIIQTTTPSLVSSTLTPVTGTNSSSLHFPSMTDERSEC